MVQEIYINKLEDVFKLISEQEYDTKIKRYRSSFLYRGVHNSSYKLTTSLQRNCKEKQKVLEESILRNFAKYAASDDPEIKESVWRQMIVGQHHGLPTRLLDWTYSPLVAMHFACSNDSLQEFGKNDICIWKIDIEEIHSLLPLKYQKSLEEKNAYLFTVDMLDELSPSLEEYDVDMEYKGMVLVEPPSIDQRIINQYSYFSVIPMGIDNIEDFLSNYTNNSVKYIIDKELQWRIRDMLDQMNLNERIMYPGLDGLSTWLRRHYFVK